MNKRETPNMTAILIDASTVECSLLQQIENSECLSTLAGQLLGTPCDVGSMSPDNVQAVYEAGSDCLINTDGSFYKLMEKVYCRDVPNPVDCTMTMILECGGPKVVNNAFQFLTADEVGPCIAEAQKIPA